MHAEVEGLADVAGCGAWMAAEESPDTTSNACTVRLTGRHRMSFTLETCCRTPRQLRQNHKALHLKHETFCPTKRAHLCNRHRKEKRSLIDRKKM